MAEFPFRDFTRGIGEDDGLALATANHVKTESGIWVPQTGNSDGSVNTQVTGRMIEQKIVEEEDVDANSRIDGNFTVDGPFRIIFTEVGEVDNFHIVVKGTNIGSGSYPYIFYRKDGDDKLGYSRGTTGFSKIYTPTQRKNDFRIVNDSDDDTKVTLRIIEYGNAVSNEFTKGLYGGEMKDGEDI